MSARHGGFDARAWLAWLVAACAVILAVDDPFVSLTALGALAVVAVRFAARAPEGRSFAFFVKLGVAITLIRLVLFGLTGHAGETVLFTVPQLSLPEQLGGVVIGGPVMLEVLAQVAAEGMKIVAFLACFGVFLSVVETSRVLRLLPRFLFEAGLVVSIALAFVPTLLRTAADVRDAQRLRGHRVRGVRSLRSLVVPVLATALERSLTLAASMEARGYGRRADDDRMRARAGVLGGVLLLALAGAASLAGNGWAGGAFVLVAVVVLAMSLRALGVAAGRTRLRPDRFDRWDRALAVVSVALLALVPVARALETARWYPYPVVTWPSADARLLALALGLAAPVVIAAVRDVSLRRAEERHPVAAEASS